MSEKKSHRTRRDQKLETRIGSIIKKSSHRAILPAARIKAMVKQDIGDRRIKASALEYLCAAVEGKFHKMLRSARILVHNANRMTVYAKDLDAVKEICH